MHFKAKKSLSNVLEFFHRLYPHTQAGGTKRLISIFKKAETAASGTIDISSEESDSVDNEIEDSDAEGDGDEIENGNVNDDDLVSVEGSSDQESILISSENSSEVLVSNANTSNGKSSTEREIIGYSTRSNRRQHQNVNELTSRQSRRDNKANVANSVNHILLDTVAIGKTGKPAPKKRN